MFLLFMSSLFFLIAVYTTSTVRVSSSGTQDENNRSLLQGRRLSSSSSSLLDSNDHEQQPYHMKYLERTTPMERPSKPSGLVQVASFKQKKSDLGVAWLMSFPNSGTSFTSKLIRRVSFTLTATNYGDQHVDPTSLQPLPVFEDSVVGGPFWGDIPSPRNNGLLYTAPTHYALTKTHCGGRCSICPPEEWVETPQSFLQDCLSGTTRRQRSVKFLGTEKNENEGDEKRKMTVMLTEKVSYSATLVKRAVHVVRNPFDNIVSRFHLEQKRDDSSVMYNNTRQGFLQFCQEMHDRYWQDEVSSPLVDQEVLDMWKDVPCHADFFRYVQWHNLAFAVTDEMLQIPSLILRYESYTHSFDHTLTQLLDFLHLVKQPHHKDVGFVTGKQYANTYFTPKQREAIEMGMKKLASRTTWKHIQHYFAVENYD